MRIDKNIIFECDDRRYAAWEEKDDVQVGGFKDNTLVTVFSVPDKESLAVQWLQASVESWLKTDDVFTLEFLKGVIFEVGELKETTVSADVKALLDKWQTVSHSFIKRESLEAPRKQGVYIIDDGYLREVLRLHNDTHNIYMASMRRTSEGKLIPLGISASPFNEGCVAVHSRIRLLGTSPFQKLGARVAIKDQFEITGFKNSVGSRSWRKLHPAATKTAPAVQRLIDQGAEITGLTQMCPYHQYHEPTMCVDFAGPWNARADGYQSPAGGSSGQGAAMAAYDWLDFAIGSDTTVSARMPAQCNGCFAIRPTWGAITNEGTWKSNYWFDTSALFGRDISKFPGFIDLWYGDKLPDKKDSTKITQIYCLAESLATPNIQQIKILRKCVEEMESCFGITAKWISLNQLWADNPPKEAGNLTLAEFVGEEVKAYTWAFADWTTSFEPFREEYIKKFGEEPFWPPPFGIDRWAAAKGVTTLQHEQGLNCIDIYRQWLRTTVFDREGQIVVMPIRNVTPNYRDTWEIPRGGSEKLYEPQMLSPVMGTPEIVVPVGEIPFVSRITKNEEYLPVCVSVMGSRGSDKQLAETIEHWLRSAGRPTSVFTGKRMFSKS